MILKVRRALPRVIPVPSRSPAASRHSLLLTSIITAHLQDLFPGRALRGFSQFRVTRDSELTIDEEGGAQPAAGGCAWELTASGTSATRCGWRLIETCFAAAAAAVAAAFQLPTEALFRVNVRSTWCA